MQYHRIPHSSLEVSTLGLGTMTFGEQNSEALFFSNDLYQAKNTLP